MLNPILRCLCATIENGGIGETKVENIVNSESVLGQNDFVYYDNNDDDDDDSDDDYSDDDGIFQLFVSNQWNIINTNRSSVNKLMSKHTKRIRQLVSEWSLVLNGRWSAMQI